MTLNRSINILQENINDIKQKRALLLTRDKAARTSYKANDILNNLNSNYYHI